MDGVINLNKPHGKTSFQMVSLVRRLSGIRKVGHSGTLDPDATGVLPILIGRATRLERFLTDSKKIYRAEIVFGSATDTYDASGNVVQSGDTTSLHLGRIETYLNTFRGDIEQIPPMYSAIKRKGKPLYHLARAGIEVEREPRKVSIYRLEIIGWQPPVLMIEVRCSKGTYIRSLAHDLGQALGCGAHLRGLVRIQTGLFHIDQSVSVDQLEKGFAEGSWEGFLYSPDYVLAHLNSIVVDASGEESIIHGRPLFEGNEQGDTDGEQRRVYSEDGRFLAIVNFDEETKCWRPKRVFA